MSGDASGARSSKQEKCSIDKPQSGLPPSHRNENTVGGQIGEAHGGLRQPSPSNDINSGNS